MTNDELIDGVSAGLAKRAALVRSVPASCMRKEAMDAAPGFLSQVGSWMAKHPELPGAALGAGIGGLTGYLRTDDEKERRRNTLMGLMAGGALGGGLGMAAHYNPWGEEGTAVESLMSRARGEAPGEESPWQSRINIGAGVGAGIGTAKGLAESKRLGALDPRTAWLRKGMDFDDVARRGLQEAGSMGGGAMPKGVEAFKPGVISTLLQDEEQFSNVMSQLRASDSAQVIVPASEKMEGLTKAINDLKGKINSAERSGITALQTEARGLPAGTFPAGRNVKIWQDQLKPLTDELDNIRKMGQPTPEIITRRQMSDLVESGVRAQMRDAKTLEPLMGERPPFFGFQQATGHGTPFLRKPWFKGGWKLPSRATIPRTAMRMGIPAAVGAGAYSLSDWIQNQLRGAGGSDAAAAEVRRRTGY